jgi:hypothetical protein
MADKGKAGRLNFGALVPIRPFWRKTITRWQVRGAGRLALAVVSDNYDPVKDGERTKAFWIFWVMTNYSTGRLAYWNGLAPPVHLLIP